MRGREGRERHCSEEMREGKEKGGKDHSFEVFSESLNSWKEREQQVRNECNSNPRASSYKSKASVKKFTRHPLVLFLTSSSLSFSLSIFFLFLSFSSFSLFSLSLSRLS